MDQFDWQGMLDFVVSCEKEQAKEVSPVNEDDQFQYYPEYDVAVLSQQPHSTDGSAFAVHSIPEAYEGYYPTTTTNTLPFNTFSLEAELQDDYNFYESSPNNYEPQQDYEVSEQDVFNSLVNGCEPAQEIPAQLVDLSSTTLEQEQKQQPESAKMEVAFPIKIEIIGYVSQGTTGQVTTKAAKRKYTAKVQKKLKTFTSDFNCATCDRPFKSKGGLTQHNQNAHSGPKPHGCGICGKRFKDFKTMQNHHQRHMATNKPFKCDECPKQFFRVSDLQRHTDLHHGMPRFSCQLCGKAFDRADHVRDHELSHENGTVKKGKRNDW